MDAAGNYQAPPPVYPPIKTPSSKMNLMDFVAMEGFPEKGRVMNLAEFWEFMTSRQS